MCPCPRVASRTGGYKKSSEEMKYMHMASIVSLKNGDLLASWQQAKEREGDWDQHIALALSKDAGVTWSAPTRLFDHQSNSARAGGDGPMWGPAMMKDARWDHFLILFAIDHMPRKSRATREWMESWWRYSYDPIGRR